MATIQWEVHFREEQRAPLFTMSGCFSKRHINGGQLFLGLPVECRTTGLYLEEVEFQEPNLLPPALNQALELTAEKNDEERVSVRLTGREGHLMKMIQMGKEAEKALNACMAQLPTRKQIKEKEREKRKEREEDEQKVMEFGEEMGRDWE